MMLSLRSAIAVGIGLYISPLEDAFAERLVAYYHSVMGSRAAASQLGV
ncbi:MAG: hypothetical protein ACOY4D_07750 [Pseudomonadota bacterium]